MGGGGGGGRDLTREDLQALEQTAKKALEEGAQPTKRDVFISFVSEDLDEVNLLRAQAKNENIGFEFRNMSLKVPFNSENADYIKRGLRERIKQASVSLVYVSGDTASSEWVDWEIRESIKLGKGVIAVYSGDTAPRSLPSALKEFGIKPIRWNAKKISEAIEKAAKDRQKPKE